MLRFTWKLLISYILLIISSSPLQAITYHTLETDHFIIQYADADARFSRHVAEESENIRTKIVADLGYGPAEKTKVIVAPTVEEFQDVQADGGKVPSWAAAVAYPGRNLIIIRSPGAVKGGHLDYHKVFIHEFTHIVMGRALRGREVPTFLAEGIAMYESSEWHVSRMVVLTKAVLMDRVIPLQKLAAQFPEDPEAAELAYAESFMFVSFLINTFGRTSFHQFIKEYAGHGDLRRSLQQMTGMHFVTLESEWLDYMKIRVSWLPLITSATTLWFLASLIIIYGYFRKKRKARALLSKWEEEEKGEHLNSE